MKFRASLAVLSFALVIGCKHEITTPDGTKVTTEGGNVTTVENDKGKMTVSANGQKVEVNGNDGSKTTVTGDKLVSQSKDGSLELNGTVTEADLGVPFYPGSSDSKGGMKATEKGKTTVQSMRETSDSGAKVVEFYTSKFGKPDTSVNSPEMSMAAWSKPKKVTVLASKNDAKTVVQVTVESP